MLGYYNDYNYNYDSITSGAAAGDYILGVFAFLGIIFIVAQIILTIGIWKVLKKAGKGGWECFIPIYRQYVLCKVVGVNPWWILIVLGCGCLSFIPVLGQLLFPVAYNYFTVLLCVSMARSFGKEDGFGVGLFFLSPIFYMILGCGESEYLGPKPMHDIIFKDKSSANTTNQQTTTIVEPNQQASDSQFKYCSGCGTKITTDTRFCPNCGQEIK